MESEEANGGGLIPPATSKPNEESPDPTSAQRGHHGISESLEMSAEQPGSAEGAPISIGQGSLSPLSTGESAEMCGRYSHPVPAGLGQGMNDLRQQQGLSELEKDPAVQESPERWDTSLNSDQGKLAHPESSQYSFPSTVPQTPTTPDKSPRVQSPALHSEFPEDQEQALACHAAVPQANHKGNSVTDTGPIQKELTTIHLLICEEVSEAQDKTETLPDETAGDSPLQGLDVTNMTTREHLPLTEAADGTNKESSPAMDSVGTADPILSVDNDEKAGGLQRGNTASSSSQCPPYPLSDDSQGNSGPTGGNTGGKMLLSSHKRGNNAFATDQKIDMAARQSPSGSINLLPAEEKERDHEQTEGSTESPEECSFQTGNTAKNTEQEKWQQEPLEQDEESADEEQTEQKQPEQGEPKMEELEKEVKPVQEEPVSEREDQKEKRWDELERKPAREEGGLEAPPPALRQGSPSPSKHNWDLHDVGESISLAEGAGLPSPLQASFSSAQHRGEDTLSSIELKACIGEESIRTQPPALIMSEGLNPEDGSPMMPSPTYDFSEPWGETESSDSSGCISINGQDCGETNQDDGASIGDGGHNDGDRGTVQRSDKGEAISLVCREVTLSPSAGNPESPRTLHPSFGATDLGSLGPANPHPVAENPAFPIHHDFTPASPSELNSTADPSHEDADEGSPTSPAGCADMDEAPRFVEEVSSQTSPDRQEADSGEGASVSTSTVSVQTPQGLVTSEKSFNEEPSTDTSISKAFRSPSPTESFPKDRDGIELTPTVHLVLPEPPDMAPPPLHQSPPTGSFVFQGKETEASLAHAAQRESSLDQSHLKLEAEEPGTGHAFNSVALPPKEVPASKPSSPLAPMSYANQFYQPPTPKPSSPLDPMSEASQLKHPLEPEHSTPLNPGPDANLPPAPEPCSPLDPMLEASQLNQPPAPDPCLPHDAMSQASQLKHHLEPEPSSPLDPMPETSQLTQPPTPDPHSPLDAMSQASQLKHPLEPEPSSPLDPMPEASQLNQPLAPDLRSPPDVVSEASQLKHPVDLEPSSPLDPMPEASQFNQPPALEPSSPLDVVSEASHLNQSSASQPSSPLSSTLELSSPLNPTPKASQLNHPPASDPSSLLAPTPDANQLNHPPASEPSSPLALMPKASHILKPPSLVSDSSQPPVPAPDADQPLLSVSNSNPLLHCTPDSSQLQANVPAPASVPAANSLVHTLDSAPDVDDGVEKLPLMLMTKEGVTGVQRNPIISFTEDVVDSSDSGVTLLAKSPDSPTLENEAPIEHPDNSLDITGQHTDTQCGKSPPYHTSWPSLGWQRTSTDSQSTNLVQPPSVLAFSNPIHFLQFSPPSPPTVRKLYRQAAVFEEPQWDQAQAGPTRVDTRNATAPVEMMETTEDARTCSQRMEGQGKLPPFLVQETRHAPLEKSSSWPDKNVTRMEVKALGLSSRSQENPIKCRAKSKDWHRQGLRKVSVNLQEEGPHKDQPASSDTVILREKKSVDIWECPSRRHSRLINSSKLLYQEYSDVALNKAIQSQKTADILAEDIELSSPSSPRLRRKVLPSQDSYLQRLSVSSTASLWQDIPKVRGSRILLNMSRDDQKLQEAKFELIMSEASYLRSLNVAVDHFQCSSELQALLTNQERKWLFSRLTDVRDVSANFLFDLEEKFEENMFTFNVCDVALRHAPEFRRVYLPYVTNQTYQEQTFQRLLNGNARFQQVLERLESYPVCQRLSLKSFLILPFQRITRLKLLLQNILKRTRPESDEEVQATQAYDALEKLIKDCNENVQRMKSTEELIYLRQKIDFECKIFPLVSQSRRLVKCGELTALDYNSLSPKWKLTTRPIYLHLFNDRLLLSRPREGGRFVVFDHAAFSDVRGEKCEMKLHGANKNVFRLFLLRNNQGKRVEFLFRTDTHSEKLRWISALAPPQGEPDLLESPDSPQVQCIRTYKARENDELDLEKADIIMVMQNSNDGWMEGVKLSDGERGWFPSEHVELISSKHARQMNLKEEQRVKKAKLQVFCKK